MQNTWVKWLLVLGCGIGVAILMRPEGAKRESRALQAIFIAAIIGSIVQPVTGSAMLLPEGDCKGNLRLGGDPEGSPHFGCRNYGWIS